MRASLGSAAVKRTRGGLSTLLGLLVLSALLAACTPPGADDDLVAEDGARSPDSFVTVSGLLTTLHAEDAVAPPIPLPFTIELPVTGQGDATFNQALVNGSPRSVSWTGGR